MEQVYEQRKNEKKTPVVLEYIRQDGYHNGSYLLLLGKRKLQSFEISYELHNLQPIAACFYNF